jgi:hypothetical protein
VRNRLADQIDGSVEKMLGGDERGSQRLALGRARGLHGIVLWSWRAC